MLRVCVLAVKRALDRVQLHSPSFQVVGIRIRATAKLGIRTATQFENHSRRATQALLLPWRANDTPPTKVPDCNSLQHDSSFLPFPTHPSFIIPRLHHTPHSPKMMRAENPDDGLGAPPHIEQFLAHTNKLQQRYQAFLDSTTPHTSYRWGATAGLLVLFVLRIVLSQGWYIGALFTHTQTLPLSFSLSLFHAPCSPTNHTRLSLILQSATRSSSISSTSSSPS